MEDRVASCAYSSLSGSGGGEVEGDRAVPSPRLRLDFLRGSGVDSGFGVGVGWSDDAGLRLADGTGLAVALVRDGVCLVAAGPTFHGSCRGMLGLS